MNEMSMTLEVWVRKTTCRIIRPRILFIQKSNQNFQRIRILQYFE